MWGSVVLVAPPLLTPMAYPVAHHFVVSFCLLVAVVLVPPGLARVVMRLEKPEGRMALVDYDDSHHTCAA